MKIVRDIKTIKKVLFKYKTNTSRIGFVPTMGAIHEGHLSLLKKSIKENDVTICSIYVNPAQFNDKKDLENYPRTESSDIAKIKKLQCDVLFMPSDKEMFPQNNSRTQYTFTTCLNKLEGEKRPGHFTGVITIVHKLFNIVQPNRAYFGEKDYQQFWIIKKFQQTFKIPVEIKLGRTIRGEEGLALSSRNQHLSIKQQKLAASIFRLLQEFQQRIHTFFHDNQSLLIDKKKLFLIQQSVLNQNIDNTSIKLDYFQIIEVKNFSFANYIHRNKKYRALIAVYISQIRLIDNIIIN